MFSTTVQHIVMENQNDLFSKLDTGGGPDPLLDDDPFDDSARAGLDDQILTDEALDNLESMFKDEQDHSINEPMSSTTLTVKPLSAPSRDRGIAAALRKKTPSPLAYPVAKLGIVGKTNKTAAKMRSNKSNGLLARAMKQKYNSSPSLHNSTSDSVEREGYQNTSWTSLDPTSSSRSSMQDMLRLYRKQSKTQSAIRQSSAQSLLKHTSGQLLSNSMDVSSLLPPQHTSINRAFANGIEDNLSHKRSNLSNLPTRASENQSLLHQSCRLYPTTVAVVESALRIDPGAVRTPITTPSQNGQSKTNQSNYGYPLNIAISHGGSLEVLKMLAEAAPEILLKKDGSEGSGSLSVALTVKSDPSIIMMLLRCNIESIKVADRRGNYPLHIAANYGAPFNIVRKLYKIYPKALEMRNFHAESPLDIAQRSTRCSEQVMNFLQTAAFSTLENASNRIEALELDDIMEANL